MTPLERRCRWLLLAYPAAYRRERGEEMIGTLLEATPDGRTWPLPRDCRAMLIAGLQVRAAQNQRLSTAASLRLAAMLGCVLYLSFEFYNLAGTLLWSVDAVGPKPSYFPQLAFAAGLLACTAIVLVVRPGGRNGAIATMVAVAVLIVGIAAADIWYPAASYFAALLVLTALALLSRGAEQLPRLWLWPPGLVVAVALLAPAASSLHFWNYFLLLVNTPGYMWLAITVLACAWIVIDARPAVGVAIFLGLTALVRFISTSLVVRALPPTWGYSLTRDALAGWWDFAWRLLAVALALVVLSSWRLRRQAAL